MSENTQYDMSDLATAIATFRIRPSRQIWAIVLLAMQCVAAIAAWVAARFTVESIVVTGPLLTIIGLALAVAVRRIDVWMPLLFGLSAPVLSALGALIIAVFHLGPDAAQRPILAILSVYLICLVPVAMVVFYQILQWPVYPFVGAPRAWRYSLKALLVLMTAVCVLTALLAGIAKSISRDFPLAFGAFGSVTIVLVGLVARQFYVCRRRMHEPLTTARPVAIDEWLFNTIRTSFLWLKPIVRCSFCGRTHEDAGPFAEGRGGSLICAECADKCARIIIDSRTDAAKDEPKAGPSDLPAT
jgi:hypothetical protein